MHGADFSATAHMQIWREVMAPLIKPQTKEGMKCWVLHVTEGALWFVTSGQCKELLFTGIVRNVSEALSGSRLSTDTGHWDVWLMPVNSLFFTLTNLGWLFSLHNRQAS